MKKLISMVTVVGLGFLSLIGVSGTSNASSVPDGIRTLTETSPLYLNKAISAQPQTHQGNMMMAEHYSHSSHYSHGSHNSHASHYSSRY